MTWYRCGQSGGGGETVIVTPKPILDVSGFTKLYSTSENENYGSLGTRVSDALDNTDITTLTAYMSDGWQNSHSCFYDSENKIGAYAGYNFGREIDIDKVSFWLGRYAGQNKSLYATVQWLDSSNVWHDVEDLDVSTSLSYPTNIFTVYLNRKCYGVRWLHKNGENKTSGNNICFFGMLMYEYVDITNIPIVNLSTWDRFKRIESSSVMGITSTNHTLTSVYNGGANIGANFTVPIDVTNINEISGYVDIGTGYSLSQFPFYVALCEKFPDSTASTPTSWSPVVQDSTNVDNSTYNFSLDTSNLTGGYMLVFILTGMNATIRDIQMT